MRQLFVLLVLFLVLLKWLGSRPWVDHSKDPRPDAHYIIKR